MTVPVRTLGGFPFRLFRKLTKIAASVLPTKLRGHFVNFVVPTVLGRSKYVAMRRHDGRWICVRNTNVDLILESPDHKRFNKNNYVPILEKLVSPGDVVVDIGASFGDEVIDLSILVGEEGRVFAFEPSHCDFIALKQTVERNGLTNVVCVNAAVGAADGKTTLQKLNKNNQTTSLSDSRRVVAAEEVDVVSLDSFWRVEMNEAKVSLVKIDTDGAEIEVLRGASSFLEAQPDCRLVVEFLPDISYSGKSGASVLEWYQKQGLAVSKIQTSTVRIEAKEFDQFCEQINNPIHALSHDVVLERD